MADAPAYDFTATTVDTVSMTVGRTFLGPRREGHFRGKTPSSSSRSPEFSEGFPVRVDSGKMLGKLTSVS